MHYFTNLFVEVQFTPVSVDPERVAIVNLDIHYMAENLRGNPLQIFRKSSDEGV